MLETNLIRTEALIGSEKLKKIKETSVMVIGLGAVGGYALEMIARLGVGKIYAVDFDVFEQSNLNRQILALTTTIGEKKCEVAVKRVYQINPEIKAVALDEKISETNLEFIGQYNPDFVIDAIDDIKAKCELIKYLVQNNIQFVSAMGAARKTNPSLLCLTTLNKTAYCPMARKIRENLKKSQIDLSQIPCVCSSEKPAEYEGVLGSIPLVPADMGIKLASFVFERI